MRGFALLEHKVGRGRRLVAAERRSAQVSQGHKHKRQVCHPFPCRRRRGGQGSVGPCRLLHRPRMAARAWTQLVCPVHLHMSVGSAKMRGNMQVISGAAPCWPQAGTQSSTENPPESRVAQQATLSSALLRGLKQKTATKRGRKVGRYMANP